MSKSKLTIDGVPCAAVVRSNANGVYLAVFDRDQASMEDIEGVNWAGPELSGPCVLPSGYGFELTGVSYSPSSRRYTAALQVARQYLGDVTGYQARVAELEAENAGKQNAIRELENRLAEADDMVIVLYEQIAASAAPAPPDQEEGSAENSGEEEQG